MNVPEESSSIEFRPRPRDIFEVNARGFAHKQWASVTILAIDFVWAVIMLPMDPFHIAAALHSSPAINILATFVTMFVFIAVVSIGAGLFIVFTIPYSWLRCTVQIDPSGLTVKSLGTMVREWKQVRWIDLTPNLIYFGGVLYDFAVPKRAFGSEADAVAFYRLCERWHAEAHDDAPPAVDGEWPPRPGRG